MRSALRNNYRSFRNTFTPSLITRALKNVMGEAASRWRSSPKVGTHPRAPGRQSFALEQIEPRLLLSADLSAGAAWSTSLTLLALDPSTVRLTDGTNVDDKTLTGDGIINVTRDTTADIMGDTLQLDLSTLDSLNLGAATTLDLHFTGGRQQVTQDLVQLTGTGNFGFDFQIESDAAVELASGASLTATSHDVTLAVNETDSGLPPIDGDKFYADATHASVTVLGDLSAHDIALTADASIDANNTSLGLGPLQLAFIYADTAATVDISGSSQVTATGKLDAMASSTVSCVADMSSLMSKTDASTDAAVASVIITSDSSACIAGSAQVQVTGALTLSSENSSRAAAIADGSAGGAGATLGLAVITGTTEASVKDSASVQAGSITVKAQRLNDLTALAKSTPDGATTPASQQDSQKALTDNHAENSDGSIDLAGAVAVGTVVSHTQAFVDSTTLIQSTNDLDIESKSVSSSQTRADGSSTVADAGADGGNGNIAIAVGIGVGDLHNDAYAGGTGGIQAGALSVKAMMGSEDRKLDFASGDVDAAKGTIDLVGGAHGLKNGDEVVYHQTGTRTISELTDGTPYYVVLQDDGKIKLSPNSDGSSPINSFTLGGSNTTDTFDLTFTDTNSRLGVTAIAGASGGATSVAGALALNVGISKTSAYVADNTAVTITGGGNVEIESENFIQVWSKSTGKQSSGSSTGVGPSFSLNVGETDTDALLGDDTTITGADDITLSADSRNDMDNTAEGAAAGKTAVAPVLAISVANNTTNASLGSLSGLGAHTDLGGALSVEAIHEGAVNTEASGDTESGDTGVGISLALSVTTDVATATTLRDIVAGGAVGFNARTVSGTKSKAKASSAGGDANDKPAMGSQAESDGGVNTKVNQQKNFASNRATSMGGKSAGDTSGSSAEASGEEGNSQKVQVAGAIGITVANTTASATIPDGRSITAGNDVLVDDGAVTVQSENNTDASAIADASTFNPGATFDATTVASKVNYTNETIDLGTSSGLSTGDQVYYRTNGGTAIGGLTNGSKYYVRDTGSGKFALYDTKAHAQDTLSTTGRVDLTDTSPTGTKQSLDPVSASHEGTGVGIAVAVNVARVTNEALVGNGTITADGLVVKALVPEAGGNKVDAFDAEATSGVSGVDTGIAGALAINIGMSHAKATIADNATIMITDGGDVDLTAENFVTNGTKATGKQTTDGKVGVGASIAVNVGMTDTLAHVGDEASITGAHDITLSASSSNELGNIAKAGSAGETAVTPSIAVSVSNNDTEATLGSYSAFDSVTDHNTGVVSLTASHEGSVGSEAEGDTDSGDTGIGISIAVTISTDTVVATTERDIDAGDSVTFEASTISTNSSDAKASVAGGKGEGSGTKSVDEKVSGQRDAADTKATTADSSASGKTASTSDASASTSGGDSFIGFERERRRRGRCHGGQLHLERGAARGPARHRP